MSGKKNMNKPKALSAERGADSCAAPCSPVYYVPLRERLAAMLGVKLMAKKRRAKATKCRIKPCRNGTLVSYAGVDGTCRKVENYKHAWLEDGTCGNCDCTRAEAGYPANDKLSDSRP